MSYINFYLLKEGASARKTQTPAAQPVPRPGKKNYICNFDFFFLNGLVFDV
jgi:hypothetical protein